MQIKPNRVYTTPANKEGKVIIKGTITVILKTMEKVL